MNECDLFLQTNSGKIYSLFLVQKRVSDFYSSVNNKCWRGKCLLSYLEIEIKKLTHTHSQFVVRNSRRACVTHWLEHLTSLEGVMSWSPGSMGDKTLVRKGGWTSGKSLNIVPHAQAVLGLTLDSSMLNVKQSIFPSQSLSKLFFYFYLATFCQS